MTQPRLYVFNYIQKILFIFNKKQVQSQPFTSFVENLTEKHTAVNTHTALHIALTADVSKLQRIWNMFMTMAVLSEVTFQKVQ